jgi:putative acetyltransferase
MKVQIRPYESADAVAMLELFYNTVHTVNSKDYAPDHLDAWAPVNPDLKKKQARFKSSKTIVAHLDGKIVGFGNLENDQSSIGMLYTHKDHQGQGIATELLEKLEKKLRKSDIKIASVESSITAKPFFEKRGYHVVKENKKMLNGTEFLNYIMEKELGMKEDKIESEAKNVMKEKSKEPKPFRWRDLFINKVFDLMIVIVGVSIAFQLNNLKLDSDQKSLERFYMESMLGDLKADKKEISEILITLNSDQKHLIEYVEKSKVPEYPADSLGPVLADLLSLETFTPHHNTYQMLVASNGLTTFSSREVRVRTTEYYNTFTSITRFEKVYTDVLFSVYKYFSPYADFGERKILDATIAAKPETKNHLLMSRVQLSDGVHQYTEALDRANALIKAIEDQLRK